ncbi:hypothetical protein BC831DRAFT_445393 [Entophlyctis helioformis]|nr:hypothetical protein BC831DRAFT_445393 [Entophlyctis helioformis]
MSIVHWLSFLAGCRLFGHGPTKAVKSIHSIMTDTGGADGGVSCASVESSMRLDSAFGATAAAPAGSETFLVAGFAPDLTARVGLCNEVRRICTDSAAIAE